MAIRSRAMIAGDESRLLGGSALLAHRRRQGISLTYKKKRRGCGPRLLWPHPRRPFRHLLATGVPELVLEWGVARHALPACRPGDGRCVPFGGVRPDDCSDDQGKHREAGDDER